jgi:EpsI family protein
MNRPDHAVALHTRAVAVVLLVACTGALAAAARRPGAVVQPQLGALPYQVDAWSGRDAGGLDPETVRILAADAYLNRTYAGESSAPVGLYIAYYGQPKPGVSIHSPLHCLPGTGWEPLDVKTLDLGPGHARRLVVRKNRDRAVVLYWYAIHGRVLASEAISKAWLLHDSVRLGRSDAALVRIVVPVASTTDAAERQALAFARDVLPYLSQLWS